MVLPLLALGSVVGGLASASAAKKGARAQADAAREANETERYIFDRNVELTEPQREIGQNALSALAFQYGVGEQPTFGGSAPFEIREINDAGAVTEEAIRAGGGKGEGTILGYRDVTEPGSTRFAVGDQTFDTREGAQEYLDGLPRTGGTPFERIAFPDAPDMSLQAFQSSPGYGFRVQQGEQGIERAMASRGMRHSGAALKALERFRQGIASDEYGAFYNRRANDYNRNYGAVMDKVNALRGLAGSGAQATQAQINAGNQFAGGTSQNLLAAGRAQAQGYAGAANAVNGTINSLGGLAAGFNSGYFGQEPFLGMKPQHNFFGG